MLAGMQILIVEDETMVALGLAAAVEDLDGRVVGPVATVADALLLLAEKPVAAAVLDANLIDRDVTPLALALLEKAVPFVVHSGTGLPDDLAAAHPNLMVVMKPASPNIVLANLFDQIDGAKCQAPASRHRDG
jgi:DNA-binding response OmpR family regulator